MRFNVKCQSPLLQHTLEYFLKENLDTNGIIITDNPEIEGILIGREIKKPFTKSSLFMQLEKITAFSEKKEHQTFQKGLEEKIDELLIKFKKELIATIKEHYAKK